MAGLDGILTSAWLQVEDAIDDMMAAFEDRGQCCLTSSPYACAHLFGLDKPLPLDSSMAEAYEKELLQSEGYSEADGLHKQLLGYLRSVAPMQA